MFDFTDDDDVALIATSAKDMEVQLNELNQGSKMIGLNIHKGKTKCMTNFQSDETIGVENDVIENVDRYKLYNYFHSNKSCERLKLKDDTREMKDIIYLNEVFVPVSLFVLVLNINRSV